MSKEPSTVDTSHDPFYKVDKVMESGNDYEAGRLKGVNIGRAPLREVDGNLPSKKVRLEDDYAGHLKREWLKAKGYEK